jgi:hypothetical protein
LAIAGDMIRRCFVISILPRCAEPETESFPFTPSEYVAAHRNELLTDAYTIMRAYRLAGMPKTATTSVGSFPDWERKIRNLVRWLTGYDLTEEFAKNKAQDPIRQEMIAFLSACDDLYTTSNVKTGGWFRASEVEADCAKAYELRHSSGKQPGSDDRKREALLDSTLACLDGGPITANKISRLFGKLANAYHGGCVLQAGQAQHANVKVWRVKRAQEE